MWRGISRTATKNEISAGDVIITGLITPPIMLEPDDEELTHAVDPIGEVSASFTRERAAFVAEVDKPA